MPKLSVDDLNKIREKSQGIVTLREGNGRAKKTTPKEDREKQYRAHLMVCTGTGCVSNNSFCFAKVSIAAFTVSIIGWSNSLITFFASLILIFFVFSCTSFSLSIVALYFFIKSSLFIYATLYSGL